MDERRDPEDLSALVTGATSGIGRQPQTSLINHTLRVHGVPTPGCGGDGQPWLQFSAAQPTLSSSHTKIIEVDTHMYSFETLKTRVDGAVLFVEIDSPPMNLLGKAIVADLVSLIRTLDKGGQHRVVVFSSAHPDFFIPHADVTEVTAYRESAASLTGKASLGLLFRRLSETKAVTIAQIAGRARGAGSEFALACDMRFASRERAVFGQIECGTGKVPGAGGVQHLARALGRGRALEVLLSSNDYDAQTAERYGWINRALPDLELASFVEALARRISQFPPDGVIGIKDRVNAITLASEAEFLVDSDLFGAGVKSPVSQARIRTLLERGMQKPGDLELNFGRALGELAD